MPWIRFQTLTGKERRSKWHFWPVGNVGAYTRCDKDFESAVMILERSMDRPEDNLCFMCAPRPRARHGPKAFPRCVCATCGTEHIDRR